MHEMQHLMSTLIDQGAIFPFAPSDVGLSSTSFGALQAPVFAALKPGTFSHLQVEAIFEAPAGASVSVEAMFRRYPRDRKRSIECRETAHLQLVDLKHPMSRESVVRVLAEDGPSLEGTLRLTAIHLGGRYWRVLSLIH